MLKGKNCLNLNCLAAFVFSALRRYVGRLGEVCQFAPDRQKCFQFARFEISGAILHEGVYDRIHGMMKGFSRIGKGQSKRTSIASHTIPDEKPVTHQFIEFEGNCTGQDVKIFCELARAVDSGMYQAYDVKRSSGTACSFPQFLQSAAQICLQRCCKSYHFEKRIEALRIRSGRFGLFCVAHEESFGIRNEGDLACI